MDGLKGTVPVKPKEENVQLSLMDIIDEKPQDTEAVNCKINNWRRDSSLRKKTGSNMLIHGGLKSLAEKLLTSCHAMTHRLAR